MNTNKMELNMNEMATVNGGMRPKSNNRTTQQINKNWLTDTVAPAFVTFGKTTCTVGKVVYNWVTGLFD